MDLIKPGMVVGLGSGSTADSALHYLAGRLADGELTAVAGISTSETIAAEAGRLTMPLTSLDEHPVIDMTIDAADEADPDWNMIKGGGGALLREKIVAQASRREVIVADHTKLSERLGGGQELIPSTLDKVYRIADLLASRDVSSVDGEVDGGSKSRPSAWRSAPERVSR